jgi:hypothetical protein
MDQPQTARCEVYNSLFLAVFCFSFADTRIGVCGISTGFFLFLFFSFLFFFALGGQGVDAV